jgi:ABC-type bacteriocin/lantibiotic exporter with double-glycine peptidase domain
MDGQPSPAGRFLTRSRGARLLVPEAVQSSAMDCGPAVLKALLEGHGVPASYGRLREACQTDVDGTSIDALEGIARELGLEADQVMLPVDYVLLQESRALPAVAVTLLPGGISHFVLVWSAHRGRLQVMDPAHGRRWPRSRDFLQDLLVHTQPVEADQFCAWAATDDFQGPLRRRLQRLGVDAETSGTLLEDALSLDGWRGPAALDAAVRVADAVFAGGVPPGAGPGVVRSLFDRAGPDGPSPALPAPYWIVRPDPEQDGRLLFRGAVLVRVRGRRNGDEGPAAERWLSAPMAAAILTPEPSRLRDLAGLVRAERRAALVGVTGAAAVAGATVTVEALLFAGLLGLSGQLMVPEHRAGGLVALAAFLLAALAVALQASRGASRLGRRLEARLRMAFLEKAPRLGDGFFSSRLRADMAERGHNIALLRDLPPALDQAVRTAAELAFTAAGLAWLYPGAGPPAALLVLLAVAIPLALQPVAAEHDLRARGLGAAVSRTYLDALLGLVPVRAHAAAGILRAQHDGLLAQWMAARLAWHRTAVLLDVCQMLPAYALAAYIVAQHARGGGAGTLLLAYWAFRLPALAGRLASSLLDLPMHRSLLVRLAEPLSAPEEEAGGNAPSAPGPGAALRLEGVSVTAGGQTLLEGVDLEIAAGEHVAIVGPSGAGKTTLVGLLLGWQVPAAGRVLADGLPLVGAVRDHLRAGTAWVEPGVQLWNRTLLANLRYGSDEAHVGATVDAVGLDGLMEVLPDGLQTVLGEGGALVSGGEGQRVRLGRALGRRAPRLAILDEPFRGLPREERRRLLQQARRHFHEATLILVTHDLDQVADFDRVVVLDGGRVVEHGVPERLRRRRGSMYRRLCAAHRDWQREAWAPERWRRFRVADGRVSEDPPGGAP